MVLEILKKKKIPPDFRVAFYTQVGLAGTIILHFNAKYMPNINRKKL